MLIFVNGYLGFGSPLGGAIYWGGENGHFVNLMKTYFKTEKAIFTDQQFPFFSSVDFRSAIGKQWLHKNLSLLEEPLQLVTFSMGTAMGIGIMEAAFELKIPVTALLAINSFQAKSIVIPDSINPDFWSLDYQNPNDYVINNPLHGKPGKIHNATYHISNPSLEKDLRFRHKSPMKLNWKEILDQLSIINY